MSKILILGHKGKIGKSLVKALSNENFTEVITYEGYLDGNSFKEFLVVNSDITCIVNTISKFRGTNTEIFKSNTQSVDILMQSLVEIDISPKIIHFSSAGVYSSTREPKDENSEISPATYYLLCKSIADRMLEYYRSEFDITIVRPGSVFGEEINDGFIYNMEKSVIETGTLTLVGSADKTRSILHVEYLLSFIVKIIKENLHLDVINLSTQTITLQEFIEFLQTRYPNSEVLKKEDLADNDKLSHMSINNTLARSILEIKDSFMLKI